MIQSFTPNILTVYWSRRQVLKAIKGNWTIEGIYHIVDCVKAISAVSALLGFVTPKLISLVY